MGPPWTVLREVSKGEYIYAVVPDHPRATKNGYVLAHRIEAENHLGRLLTRDELVHHENENKRDNRWSNLVVITVAAHNRHHHFKGLVAELICEECEAPFQRPWRNRPEAKGYKHAFCTRRCGATFRRREQLAAVAERI